MSDGTNNRKLADLGLRYQLRRQLSAPPTWRLLLIQLCRLALPLCLVEIGLQALSLVDIAIVGRTFPTQLAGTSVGATLYFIPAIAVSGLMLGIDPLLSRAIARGDDPMARAWVRRGARGALLIGIPLSLAPFLLWILAAPIPMGSNTRLEALFYLVGRAPSLCPALIVLIRRSYWVARQQVQRILWSVLLANIVNACLDYVFVKGAASNLMSTSSLAAQEELAVLGVGFASTVATLVQVLVLSPRSHLGDSEESRYAAVSLRPIFRLGIPASLQRLADVGMIMTVGFAAGNFGAAEQSAHYVAMQIVSFAFTLALGTSQATCTRVGLSVGASMNSAARHILIAGMLIVTVMMGVGGAIFCLSSCFILPFLVASPTIVAKAMLLVHVACIFMVADGLQLVAVGALRGAGEARQSLWFTALSHIFLGIPIGFFLAFSLHMRTVGLWWGMTAAFVLATALLVSRFFRALRDLDCQPTGAGNALH